MYKLIVLQDLQLEDGRIYAVGHDCNSLSAFEVAELVYQYPEHFEAGDSMTVDFMANSENVERLAKAAIKKGA